MISGDLVRCEKYGGKNSDLVRKYKFSHKNSEVFRSSGLLVMFTRIVHFYSPDL